MILIKTYQLLTSSGEGFYRSTAVEKTGRRKGRRNVVRKKAEKFLGSAWVEIIAVRVSGYKSNWLTSHCKQPSQFCGFFGVFLQQKIENKIHSCTTSIELNIVLLFYLNHKLNKY